MTVTLKAGLIYVSGEQRKVIAHEIKLSHAGVSVLSWSLPTHYLQQQMRD